MEFVVDRKPPLLSAIGAERGWRNRHFLSIEFRADHIVKCAIGIRNFERLTAPRVGTGLLHAESVSEEAQKTDVAHASGVRSGERPPVPNGTFGRVVYFFFKKKVKARPAQGQKEIEA